MKLNFLKLFEKYIISLISLFLFLTLKAFKCQILDYKHISNWNSLCSTGQSQSPINFPSDISFFPLNPNFQIVSSSYKDITNTFVDFYFDENKFVMKLNNTGYVKIKKKIEYLYNLKEIIFHMRSEHTFDTQNADLEMQLVHEKDQNYLLNRNILIDSDSFNQILVISTLFRATAKVNNTFIQNLNFKNRVLLNPLSLNAFVQNISYFYYTGSLTTPGCEENVDWVVNMNFGFMTPAQLMDIAYFINYIFIEGNNRSVQPLNGRTIYVSTKNFKGFNQLPLPIVCSLASISSDNSMIRIALNISLIIWLITLIIIM